MRAKKFAIEERKYWANVLVASSQVTFGVAWTSIFFPSDKFRILVAISNLTVSGIIWVIGWLFIRRIR